MKHQFQSKNTAITCFFFHVKINEKLKIIFKTLIAYSYLQAVELGFAKYMGYFNQIFGIDIYE